MRGAKAREEFKVELDAKRRADRNDAVDKAISDLAAAKAKTESGMTTFETSFPYDTMLRIKAEAIYSDYFALVEAVRDQPEVRQSHKDELDVLTKKCSQALVKALKSRKNNDDAYLGELIILKDSKVKVKTLAEMDTKLQANDDLKALWQNFKDACSAEEQRDTEIRDMLANMRKHYKEQVTAASNLPFDRANSTTWKKQPVKWSAKVKGWETTVKALKDWPAIGAKLTACTLEGNTRTRGTVLLLDIPMHAHLLGGNKGLGFMYKTGDNGEVTPWVVDYAASRTDNNEYHWEVTRGPSYDPAFINGKKATP